MTSHDPIYGDDSGSAPDVYIVSGAYDDFSSTGLYTIALFAAADAARAYASTYASARGWPVYDTTAAPIDQMFFDPGIVIERHPVHTTPATAPTDR